MMIKDAGRSTLHYVCSVYCSIESRYRNSLDCSGEYWLDFIG